jgi:tRNA threonylcarbamoyladenosine biosynthesis protein TsaB
MKILALEFSSAERSAAVSNNGRVSNEVVETGGREMRPFALIEEALREAGAEREQVDCIAVGIGPGSYTGIRAAISLAQGWQLARGVKLLGISSVEAIAAEAQTTNLRGRVNVVIDAQRNEFYLADFDITANGYSEVTPLRITGKAEIELLQSMGEIIVGPEASKWFPSAQDIFPHAATVARLASTRTDFVEGQSLTPIYLRQVSFVKAPPPRNWH